MAIGSFNALINLHAKRARPDRAQAMLTLMQEAGVRPSLVTYNSLASAHAACVVMRRC